MRKIIFSLAMLAFTGLSQRADAQIVIDNGSCGTSLTWELTELNGDTTLTISGSGAMQNYGWHEFPWTPYTDAIKTVIIGDSVTTIGDFAFELCSSLTNVQIGNSVTRICQKAFWGCPFTSIPIPNSVTDAGVGALCARSAVLGAYLNVRINAGSLKDKTFVDNILSQAEEMSAMAQKIEGEILAEVNKKMS